MTCVFVCSKKGRAGPKDRPRLLNSAATREGRCMMNAMAMLRGQRLIHSLYGLSIRPTMAHWWGHNTSDASSFRLLLGAIAYCVLRIAYCVLRKKIRNTQYAIRNTFQLATDGRPARAAWTSSTGYS